MVCTPTFFGCIVRDESSQELYDVLVLFPVILCQEDYYIRHKFPRSRVQKRKAFDHSFLVIRYRQVRKQVFRKNLDS
jgi:hypothetical protein